MQTFSILIPVYNEQAYLERLVERVMAAWIPDGLRKEIIVVNDASKDKTAAVIKRLCERWPEIRAFEQPVNMGKGAAIRRAIEEMTGDYAIIQDADLEYDPNEYRIVLRPLQEGYADVVYGSRFAASDMRKVLFFHHKLGNYFLTFLSNLMTGLDLTDMETCYKAFRGKVLKSIPLRSNRFGFEPEITAKIAKRGFNVYEVPISYHGRKYSEGKKIGWKDGVSALWTILKFWFLDDYAYESDELHIVNSSDNTRRINREIVQRAMPHLGTRILEVGSRVGLISRLLPQRESLTVSDSRERCVEFLKNHYDGNAMVTVEHFDLNKEPGTERNKEPGTERSAVPGHDTVLFIHGLQQTERDTAALQRIFDRLEPHGRLILVVPRFPSFWGPLDEALGNRRRYTNAEIEALLKNVGFRVVTCYGFNPLSTIAWWQNRRRSKLGKIQLKILNALTPFARWLPIPGGNVFAVAEKPSDR